MKWTVLRELAAAVLAGSSATATSGCCTVMTVGRHSPKRISPLLPHARNSSQYCLCRVPQKDCQLQQRSRETAFMAWRLTSFGAVVRAADSVFFPEGVARAVQGLDPDIPYFISGTQLLSLAIRLCHLRDRLISILSAADRCCAMLSIHSNAAQLLLVPVREALHYCFCSVVPAGYVRPPFPSSGLEPRLVISCHEAHP